AVAEKFPKTSFYISTGTSQEIFRRLTDGQIDIAFMLGPVNEPGISSFPLFSTRLAWLASAEKFDVEKEIDIIELSRLPLLLPRSNSSSYDMVIEYFRTYGIQDVPSKDGKLVLDCIYSFGTAAHLVRSGAGVSALPPFFFRDEIRSGSVGIVPVRQK